MSHYISNSILMAQIEETMHFNIRVDMAFHTVKYFFECDVHMTEYNFTVNAFLLVF